MATYRYLLSLEPLAEADALPEERLFRLGRTAEERARAAPLINTGVAPHLYRVAARAGGRSLLEGEIALADVLGERAPGLPRLLTALLASEPERLLAALEHDAGRRPLVAEGQIAGALARLRRRRARAECLATLIRPGLLELATALAVALEDAYLARHAAAKERLLASELASLLLLAHLAGPLAGSTYRRLAEPLARVGGSPEALSGAGGTG